jgi:hypothetical protein
VTAYNKLLKQSHIDIHSLTKPLIQRENKKRPHKGRSNTVAVGQHNKFVRRIFSRGSWHMHGRFYGGWWQQIGSELRRHIFINGKAVNKLPKYVPCEQYLDRLNRFCDAHGLVANMTNKGRGLLARTVYELITPKASTLRG